jgi:hypothetical protein
VTLAILTPSYAPDFDDFAELHRSVLQFTDPTVLHYVVVPDEDLPLFGRLRSNRMVLVGYRGLLPSSFLSTAWFARAAGRIPRMPRGARFIAVNTRHPWPPLRGWLLQQVVKLGMAMRAECDTLVVIDSDAQLIRPITDQTFASSGAVRFYRSPGAITAGMARHVTWHQTARRMLGVPPDGPPPHADPIGSLVSWDPEVVRGCTARIAEVASRPWETAVSREWEFSEYVLYGEYLAEFGTPRQLSFTADDSLCHSHWDSHPLDAESARRFVDSIAPHDVAVHVQSTSHTSPEVVRYIRSTAGK